MFRRTPRSALVIPNSMALLAAAALIWSSTHSGERRLDAEIFCRDNTPTVQGQQASGDERAMFAVQNCSQAGLSQSSFDVLENTAGDTVRSLGLRLLYLPAQSLLQK